jgi:hypothetical protein
MEAAPVGTLRNLFPACLTESDRRGTPGDSSVWSIATTWEQAPPPGPQRAKPSLGAVDTAAPQGHFLELPASGVHVGKKMRKA